MPTIRLISDLQNNFNDISKQVHESGQPVFLTRNGHNDMVVMSVDAYERMEARLELHDFLDAGLAAMEHGDTVSVNEAFEKLKAKKGQQAR